MFSMQSVKSVSHISPPKVIFNFPSSKMLNDDCLARLPVETLNIIMGYLSDDEQKNLSRTCKWLYRFARKYKFGFVAPFWDAANYGNVESIDNTPFASNYRDGVWINDTFYLIIFGEDDPVCWSLNLKEERITWSKTSITIESSSRSFYEPVRKSAVASVGDSIYIFGGKNIEIGKLTNVFYELNTKTFVIKILNSTATPLARKNHSLHTIDNNRLVMFGGRRLIKGDDEPTEMCDTQDFAIYNIEDNSWVSYTDSRNFPYRRSLHSATFFNGRLYIYGGKSKNSTSKTSQIHDDNDIHVYDVLQDNWLKFLAPSNDAALPTLLPLPTNWIATTGRNPGRRKCAAICFMHNRIGIFGGSEKENWSFENESRPWEFLKLLTPENRNWEHVRVKDFPQMDCNAVLGEYKNEAKGIFVIGKDRGKNLILGWIKDSTTYLI